MPTGFTFPLSTWIFFASFATPLGKKTPRIGFEITGCYLSVDDLFHALRNPLTVRLTEGAKRSIRNSFNLAIEAASKGTPIYGLTVGVGRNKDTEVFKDGRLSEKGRSESEEFNKNLLRSHSAGSGGSMDPGVVRTAMLIRLSQIAMGYVGCQPSVAEHYVDFLNHDLMPVIPEDGSVGMSDILLSSHVGLAMIGEWFVFRNGVKVSSSNAMKDVGIEPLKPFGKDALSILSNNALSVSLLLSAMARAERMIAFSTPLFAASLEAINGNISPLLPYVSHVRPLPYADVVSEMILTHLNGSHLFESDPMRALQDPLSYRGAHWPIAHAINKFMGLKELLELQIASSDDNPLVFVDAPPTKYDKYSQVAQYLTLGNVSGVVCSTSNYDTTMLASETECFLNAMVHLAKYSVNRQIKLYNPEFTKLTRALADPNSPGSQAFSVLQNTVVALLAEAEHAANPLSFSEVAMQGGIEDISTNLLQISGNLMHAIRNIETIYGVELMQVVQALDLRTGMEHSRLSRTSESLRATYRRKVKFYSSDRPITPDIAESAEFLRSLMTDRKLIQDPTGQFVAKRVSL